MPARPALLAIALAILWCGPASAQNPVRTERISPPANAAAPDPNSTKPKSVDAQKSPAPAEIITDLGRLPPPVARTRERIMAAARSGDLGKLVAVMQTNETMPVFSFGNDRDPVAFWKATYPDSDGIEALAILIEILEAGYVHVDRGTAQEMFVWPYFARMPLGELTAEQKVELFKIVTGSDFRDMKEFGAYIFYRLGIAPDGTWHFFVAGD